jgi:hypothetical protein
MYKKVQNDEQIYLQFKNMKQEKKERIEIYYDILFKLANSLQHGTINSFLTIVFKSWLQPYLHVSTTSMKR